MVRAVIFDFDGVLANSEPLHFRAFRDVAAERGLVLTEAAYYGKYLGFDDVGAFRAMGADGGVPLNDTQIREMVDRKAHRLEALERGVSVLFPGAREAIGRMAEFGPIAIASGALRAEIVRVLDREDLRAFFPVLVAAEDTPSSKPSPAPYALAVALLARATSTRLAPGECVAVEDSRWGLQSARSAGLRTIAITHSYQATELTDADVVISHLDELDHGLVGGLR